jgi:hypothetical protein
MLTAVSRTLVADFVDGDHPAPASIKDDFVEWLKRNVAFVVHGAWRKLSKDHTDKNLTAKSLSKKEQETMKSFERLLVKHGYHSDTISASYLRDP